MRFLVTGATGKVGNAVARRLVERGDEVVALVRDAAAPASCSGGRRAAVGDVTDAESLRRAAEGVEGVFNCMGIFEQWMPDPGVFERVNAEGARNVVAAAREAGARRVVHTSTFDVFHAEQGGTVSEDGLADYPKGTAYERSKQRAEELVLGRGRRRDRGRDLQPGRGLRPRAVGGERPRRGAARRAPPPAAGAAAGRHDARLRRRRRRRPPRGIRSRRPGERYILADGSRGPGRSSRPRSRRPAVAGRRRRCRRASPAASRAAGEAVSRRDPAPAAARRGQLHFLLWEARADNSKAREELGVDFTPWQRGNPPHGASGCAPTAGSERLRSSAAQRLGQRLADAVDLLLGDRREEGQGEQSAPRRPRRPGTGPRESRSARGSGSSGGCTACRPSPRPRAGRGRRRPRRDRPPWAGGPRRRTNCGARRRGRRRGARGPRIAFAGGRPRVERGRRSP